VGANPDIIRREGLRAIAWFQQLTLS
jgi:hypothetical protein